TRHAVQAVRAGIRTMEMTFSTPDMWPVLPEIFLLGMACIILIADLFFDESRRIWTHWLTLGALAGTAWLLGGQMGDPAVTTFGGMYVADTMARVLKLGAVAAPAGVRIYSQDYLKSREIYQGE